MSVSLAKLNVRGVFAGSGSAALSEMTITNAIMDLVEPGASLNANNSFYVVYIGTATYDVADSCLKQTRNFTDRGCTVHSLNLTICPPIFSEIESEFAKANIIIISGGILYIVQMPLFWYVS